MASSGEACLPEFPGSDRRDHHDDHRADLGARATVDDLAGVAPRLLLDASRRVYCIPGEFGIPIRGCGTSVAQMI